MSANRRTDRYGQEKEERKRKRRRQTKRHICRLIVMDSNTLGAPGRTNERLRSASGLKRRRSRRRRRSRMEPEQLRGELSRVTANGQTMAANLRPTYAGMWHVAVSFVLATTEREGRWATAAFSSVRPVARLACCQRITRQHVQHISNGSCSPERTDEQGGKGGSGGYKTRLLLPLVICSTIFHYATPACDAPSPLINPSPGEFTI